jgi:hypothetical protein
MSLENLLEFSNHSKDYLQTRVIPNPGIVKLDIDNPVKA